MAMPHSHEYLENKLNTLETQDVTVIDRRQTYLDEEVEVRRISPGTVLYPGTRLVGSQTFIGPGAKIGTEGPAVLINSIIGQDAEIGSGYLNGAVLLRNARIGSNAHIRPGTLLEEEASIAHAVGLKHTILMSFVSMGSLINFCDGLISGGRSKKEHTEVGSGFIHFNYTPKGHSGDKATPSLVGDVVHGVFLRQPRIFLGGLSGLVGPQKVGFGSFTVAGQILRKEVPPNRMFGDVPRQVDKAFNATVEAPGRVVRLNLEYIGQLTALKAWYGDVRLARIPASQEYLHIRTVTQAALELLDLCIVERIERLRAFLEERKLPMPSLSFPSPSCPLRIKASSPYLDHVDWIAGLSHDDVETGSSWLQSIVDSIGGMIR